VLQLITASTPAEPVLDIALSHALLDDVAAGRRGDVLRIYRPGPTAAFGRLDMLRPGFAAASAVARGLGLEPVVRSAGGHAAPYDDRSLVVEHIVMAPEVTAGLEERFSGLSSRLDDVLTGLGAAARVGELPGEYCPGAHSIHVDGRLKVAGIAQRAVRGGALTGAVLTVGGGPELRAMIAAIYAALELDVDAATAGALDEALPGVTPDVVADAIRESYAAGGGLVPAAPDPALLDAARALIPRHAVP
jgi:octanoyl-[GcvH]:protein N-octanoyltransferase